MMVTKERRNSFENWIKHFLTIFTMFENHRKSLIHTCERSELRLHIDEQTFIKNAKNGQFWKPDAWGQTVIPECSILTGQKLIENAKIRHFELYSRDFFGQKQSITRRNSCFLEEEQKERNDFRKLCQYAFDIYWKPAYYPRMENGLKHMSSCEKKGLLGLLFSSSKKDYLP